MNNNSEPFNYTYSAKQQEEIEEIRKKYIFKEEDKMDRLRRLDRSVTKPGTIISLIVGIISTLVMGAGMSMCMEWTDTLLIPGIIIGVLGIIGVCSAYPVYSAVTKRQRKRITPEIIRLSDELRK